MSSDIDTGTETLELDFVNTIEAPLDTAVELYAARFGVTAEVTTPAGPAGWPVVRFTGTVERLAALQAAYDDE